MAIRHLLTQPVEHWHPAGELADEHNNPVSKFVCSHRKGLLQQNAQWEAKPEESPVTGSGFLFLDASVIIGSDDYFIVDGQRWEAIGPPRKVFNPRHRRHHHLEVEVRTSDG